MSKSTASPSRRDGPGGAAEELVPEVLGEALGLPDGQGVVPVLANEGEEHTCMSSAGLAQT